MAVIKYKNGEFGYNIGQILFAKGTILMVNSSPADYLGGTGTGIGAGYSETYFSYDAEPDRNFACTLSDKVTNSVTSCQLRSVYGDLETLTEVFSTPTVNGTFYFTIQTDGSRVVTFRPKRIGPGINAPYLLVTGYMGWRRIA